MSRFVIKNSKTLKVVKSCITTKPMTFDTEEKARYFADSMERDSVLDKTAFNSVRPSKYQVYAI